MEFNIKKPFMNAAILAAVFFVLTDTRLTAFADSDVTSYPGTTADEAGQSGSVPVRTFPDVAEDAFEVEEEFFDYTDAAYSTEGPSQGWVTSPGDGISYDSEGFDDDWDLDGTGFENSYESNDIDDFDEQDQFQDTDIYTDSDDTSPMESESFIDSDIDGFQPEKFDNLDEPPVLDGGEVRFLANLNGSAQQLSAVFKSSDGKVIVVDGGQAEDTEHLVGVIKEFGSKVDAWLITHPQTDHVGALVDIINSGRDDIEIEGVYYSFFEQSWYDKNDSEEAGMTYMARKALLSLDESKRHSDIKRGDKITLSENLSFRVLNNPIKTTGAFAGNGAGIMYDIDINGEHFIILGDMTDEAGNIHMKDGVLKGIVCDYVQIAHHGQAGVSNEFYSALRPKNCIWPTNEHIYNKGTLNSIGLGTAKTKLCISKLSVETNYVTLGRDVIIR